MFFINLGKKIARGIGYTICALLFVLCVGLIVLSSLFDAKQMVNILGFNVYIAQTNEFDSVDEGDAVIAVKCAPYDLNEDNLVLYNSGDAVNTPKLGYVDSIRMADGAYMLTISDNNGTYEIHEAEYIAKADTVSPVLGAVIRFSVTPFGIVVMAVIPCLALILFDIIRTAIAKLPPPEVVPQVKNSREDNESEPAPVIKVKSDGNATYSRSSAPKATSADRVLFNYTGAQRSSATKTDVSHFDRTPQKPAEPVARPEPKRSPATMKQDEPSKTPAPVAAKRYIDTATQTAPTKSNSSTTEIPALSRPKASDAFFTQSQAPQIGRKSLTPEKSGARAVIDLEDALASAGEKSRTAKDSHSGGKRSAEILAAKSRSELITEDDDSLDKSRYEIEDILAGLEKRRKS